MAGREKRANSVRPSNKDLNVQDPPATSEGGSRRSVRKSNSNIKQPETVSRKRTPRAKATAAAAAELPEETKPSTPQRSKKTFLEKELEDILENATGRNTPLEERGFFVPKTRPDDDTLSVRSLSTFLRTRRGADREIEDDVLSLRSVRLRKDDDDSMSVRSLPGKSKAKPKKKPAATVVKASTAVRPKGRPKKSPDPKPVKKKPAVKTKDTKATKKPLRLQNKIGTNRRSNLLLTKKVRNAKIAVKRIGKKKAVMTDNNLPSSGSIVDEEASLKENEVVIKEEVVVAPADILIVQQTEYNGDVLSSAVGGRGGKRRRLVRGTVPEQPPVDPAVTASKRGRKRKWGSRIQYESTQSPSDSSLIIVQPRINPKVPKLAPNEIAGTSAGSSTKGKKSTAETRILVSAAKASAPTIAPAVASSSVINGPSSSCASSTPYFIQTVANMNALKSHSTAQGDWLVTPSGVVIIQAVPHSDRSAIAAAAVSQGLDGTGVAAPAAASLTSVTPLTISGTAVAPSTSLEPALGASASPPLDCSPSLTASAAAPSTAGSAAASSSSGNDSVQSPEPAQLPALPRAPGPIRTKGKKHPRFNEIPRRASHDGCFGAGAAPRRRVLQPRSGSCEPLRFSASGHMPHMPNILQLGSEPVMLSQVLHSVETVSSFTLQQPLAYRDVPSHCKDKKLEKLDAKLKAGRSSMKDKTYTGLTPVKDEPLGDEDVTPPRVRTKQYSRSLESRGDTSVGPRRLSCPAEPKVINIVTLEDGSRRGQTLAAELRQKLRLKFSTDSTVPSPSTPHYPPSPENCNSVNLEVALSTTLVASGVTCNAVKIESEGTPGDSSESMQIDLHDVTHEPIISHNPSESNCFPTTENLSELNCNAAIEKLSESNNLVIELIKESNSSPIKVDLSESNCKLSKVDLVKSSFNSNEVDLLDSADLAVQESSLAKCVRSPIDSSEASFPPTLLGSPIAVAAICDLPHSCDSISLQSPRSAEISEFSQKHETAANTKASASSGISLSSRNVESFVSVLIPDSPPPAATSVGSEFSSIVPVTSPPESPASSSFSHPLSPCLSINTVPEAAVSPDLPFAPPTPPPLPPSPEPHTSSSVTGAEEGESSRQVPCSASDPPTSVVERSKEDLAIKESILSALGLQTLKAAEEYVVMCQKRREAREQAAMQALLAPPAPAVVASSSGTLKTVIKRLEKKGNGRMTYKASCSSSLGADVTHEPDDHPADPSANAKELHDSGDEEGKNGTGKAKALVIPEKASSFSIHPHRVCSDVCTYCFGKFGLLDTPCHIAQLKDGEKRRTILKVETHLTHDSCLCDACFRHVDKKASGISVSERKPGKRKLLVEKQVRCSVENCDLEAQHNIRRKTLLKLKRSLGKKLILDQGKLDKLQPAHLITLCNRHIYWVDYFLSCGICNKRLANVHMYRVGPEVVELNAVLGSDGIPTVLTEKRFLCKLCQCYSSIRLKHKDPQDMNASQRQFYESCRKRILQNHGIDVPDSDGVDVDVSGEATADKNGKSKSKKLKPTATVTNGTESETIPTTKATNPQDLADLRAKFKAHPPPAPGGFHKYSTTLQFTKETKNLFYELQRPYGNHSSFFRHLVMLEKLFRSGDLVLSRRADTPAVKYITGVQNRLKSYEGLPQVSSRPFTLTAVSVTAAPAPPPSPSPSTSRASITPAPSPSISRVSITPPPPATASPATNPLIQLQSAVHNIGIKPDISISSVGSEPRKLTPKIQENLRALASRAGKTSSSGQTRAVILNRTVGGQKQSLVQVTTGGKTIHLTLSQFRRIQQMQLRKKQAYLEQAKSQMGTQQKTLKVKPNGDGVGSSAAEMAAAFPNNIPKALSVSVTKIPSYDLTRSPPGTD